jgi:hypothetical protein
MANDAHLVAVRDGEGVPTGYSKCSLCNVEFSGDPGDAKALSISFAVHVGHVHGTRQKPIEDMSERAARVVEEAMRMMPKRE